MNIPNEAQFIIQNIELHNEEAFLVGGCVRDFLMNKLPKDYDICTSAAPEKTKKIFEELNCKVILTGIQHGTVTVVVNKENFEITTYRVDGDYLNGRKPETVSFTKSIYEDLKRRDLTINAIAYSPKKGFIDPHHGEADIKNKLIKAVGDPLKRFEEDALRMLRAIRFVAQLDFNLTLNTKEAILIKKENLRKVSKERITEELNKILLSKNPAKGLKLLNELEMLDYVIPELKPCVNFEQYNPHHDKDVFNHILEVIENIDTKSKSDLLILRLAALFHDIGKPSTFTISEIDNIGHFYGHELKSYDLCLDIMKRMKYDNKTIKTVSLIVKNHMRQLNLKKKSLKRFINSVGPENTNYIFNFMIADKKRDQEKVNLIKKIRVLCDEIKDSNEAFSKKDLKIDGADIISLGIDKGPLVGKILNELLEKVIDDPQLNDFEKLKNIISKDFLNK